MNKYVPEAWKIFARSCKKSACGRGRGERGRREEKGGVVCTSVALAQLVLGSQPGKGVVVSINAPRRTSNNSAFHKGVNVPKQDYGQVNIVTKKVR